MGTAVAEKKTEEGKNLPAGQRDPWRDFGLMPLNRLRQEFDDLWNKYFTEMPALWNAERTDMRWAFGVEDTPDAYVITAEAPGFDLGDFDVELRGDQLVLQAKKSQEEKSSEQQSFTSTEFYRAMTIPDYVDADRIEAQYAKGVLTVMLPKTPDGKGRKIPVKG
ncbi:MAG: Hsp20/alpha crystallin family protein [Planctomycetaceae bacterium]|nr:Hsp20/alpha crystallin family protein [Planctomycetaceae bacterium]